MTQPANTTVPQEAVGPNADPATAAEPVLPPKPAHRRPSAGIVIPAQAPQNQPSMRRYLLGPTLFAVSLLLIMIGMLWLNWRRNGETLQDKFRQVGRGVESAAAVVSGLQVDPTGGDDPAQRQSALRTASRDVLDATEDQVVQCFAQFGPKDRDYRKAQVFVEIAPGGAVKYVQMREVIGRGLLFDCISHVVTAAKWPQGVWGQITINYPLPDSAKAQ